MYSTRPVRRNEKSIRLPTAPSNMPAAVSDLGPSASWLKAGNHTRQQQQQTSMASAGTGFGANAAAQMYSGTISKNYMPSLTSSVSGQILILSSPTSPTRGPPPQVWTSSGASHHQCLPPLHPRPQHLETNATSSGPKRMPYLKQQQPRQQPSDYQNQNASSSIRSSTSQQQQKQMDLLSNVAVAACGNQNVTNQTNSRQVFGVPIRTDTRRIILMGGNFRVRPPLKFPVPPIVTVKKEPFSDECPTHYMDAARTMLTIQTCDPPPTTDATGSEYLQISPDELDTKYRPETSSINVTNSNSAFPLITVKMQNENATQKFDEGYGYEGNTGSNDESVFGPYSPAPSEYLNEYHGSTMSPSSSRGTPLSVGGGASSDCLPYNHMTSAETTTTNLRQNANMTVRLFKPTAFQGIMVLPGHLMRSGTTTLPSFWPTRTQPSHRNMHVCQICGFSCSSKFHFNSHMNTHANHKCDFCDYTSRTECRLKWHMKEFHPPPGSVNSYGDGTSHNSSEGGSSNQATSKKPKIYKCKQCAYTARSKEDFWAHMRAHIKFDRLLTCPKCPFVTEHRCHLEYHLRNHFGSKPFKCAKCNYSCVNKSMLNSHMKSHSNYYQYRCADCTYTTKYCQSLKVHLRKYAHTSSMGTPDGAPLLESPIVDIY